MHAGKHDFDLKCHECLLLFSEMLLWRNLLQLYRGNFDVNEHKYK